MLYETLNKVDAEKYFKENTIKELELFDTNDNGYKKIVRTELLKKHNTILVNEFKYKGEANFQIPDKKKYDLLFALELYEYLTFDLDIKVRESSNLEFWYYLSILVIPDIVSLRWGDESPARFYSLSRRNYLSNLWWYIHLSWQGSKEATYVILKENTTDVLMNLVERSGSAGYRVELYRELMKEYSKVDREKHRQADRVVFRKLMIQNTMVLKTTEPELMENGVEEYVSNLFLHIGMIFEDGSYC